MFDVSHYEETSREEIMRKYFIKPSNVRTAEAGESATLVGYENTPMFRLDELRVSGSLTVPGLPTFSGLYVLEGRGSCAAGGREYSYNNFPMRPLGWKSPREVMTSALCSL